MHSFNPNKYGSYILIQFSDNDVSYLTLFLSFLRSIMMKMTHATITIKNIISKVANTATTILLSLFAPSVDWAVNIVLTYVFLMLACMSQKLSKF